MLKLKSYEDFFKDVEAEGEFKCFDYSDEVKKYEKLWLEGIRR